MKNYILVCITRTIMVEDIIVTEPVVEPVLEPVTNKIVHPTTIINNFRKIEYEKLYNTLKLFFDFTNLHSSIEHAIVRGWAGIYIARFNSNKRYYYTIDKNYNHLRSDEIARRISYIEKGLVIDDICIKHPLILEFQASCSEPYFVNWIKEGNNYYLEIRWRIQPPPSKKMCCFL